MTGSSTHQRTPKPARHGVENRPTSRARTPTPRALRASTAGFTLIEVLVAITISLVLLAGVLTVFAANQNAYKTKSELDTAQDTFRFTYYTISRLARIADEALIKDNGKMLELVVDLDDFERDVAGCDQAFTAHGEQRITLAFQNDGLTCGGDQFATDIDVAASRFEPVPNSDGRAVEVHLVMLGDAQLQTRFTVALRNRIVRGEDR